MSWVNLQFNRGTQILELLRSGAGGSNRQTANCVPPPLWDDGNRYARRSDIDRGVRLVRADPRKIPAGSAANSGKQADPRGKDHRGFGAPAKGAGPEVGFRCGARPVARIGSV